MNTQPTSSVASRKELANSVQKGAFFLLLILFSAFAALYALMNMNLEKHNVKQKPLNEFIELVHGAEESWIEWLLIEDKEKYGEGSAVKAPQQLHGILYEEYKLISQNVSQYNELAEIDLTDSLSFLEQLLLNKLEGRSLSSDDRKNIYSSLKVLEYIGDELIKLNIAVDYERQLHLQQLVWGPIVIFIVVTMLIIVMVTRFNRRLKSGFSNLHYVLDHHEHGHVLNIPSRYHVDEFTDLERLIDNELASQHFDIIQKNEKLDLITMALSKVDDFFFVVDDAGDFAWLSAGAERLWLENITLFESTFKIDSGLDSPVGERISDELLALKEGIVLKLSDGVYMLTVDRFDVGLGIDKMHCLVTLKLQSELAELKVLHNSLKLMAQDVWDVPIRLLRGESPYASFAASLEIIRRKVVDLLETTSYSIEDTNAFEKITKLQQIASLIDKKANNNVLSDNELGPSENQKVTSVAPIANDTKNTVSDGLSIQESGVKNLELEGIQIELNDMAWLSEQVRDSLILGYELVLQRLSLVEKDLSSDVFLLDDVDRCLNEVRAGVLTSLSASEGEAENIRRRFAVDLEHDISQVQNQMEGMKTMAATTLSLLEADRSVGVARLDRARESINEIVDKIHGLMAKTTQYDEADDKLIEPLSNGDEWDEL